jgi:hypothetical protein
MNQLRLLPTLSLCTSVAGKTSFPTKAKHEATNQTAKLKLLHLQHICKNLTFPPTARTREHEAAT